MPHYDTKKIAEFTAMLRDTGPSAAPIRLFRSIIGTYFKRYGRHDLPWRHTDDPYHILVSEIMLQQTQVERVTGKYLDFTERFTDFQQLAQGPAADVLKLWKGLGYNRRALALYSIARAVVSDHGGQLPTSPDILESFPGIGRATACSICAFAFNRPVVFLETNIRRVFIHFFFPDHEDVRDSEILPLVEKTLSPSSARTWYAALMDYGTMLKKHVANPNVRSAHYTVQSPFKGSRRQLRGNVLGLLLEHEGATARKLSRLLNADHSAVKEVVSHLCKEGFLKKRGQQYTLV